MMSRSFLVLALSTAALLAACSEDAPSSPSDGLDTASMGRLTILLTDAPLEGVEEVHVWITAVSTKPRNAGVIRFDRELGDIELLSLRGKEIEVVNTTVPSGTYEYVDFHIDEGRSRVVESGATKPLAVPAGSARVLGPFEVVAGETRTITLDFDAEKSLRQRSDGSWALEPVIVVLTSSGEPSTIDR